MKYPKLNIKISNALLKVIFLVIIPAVVLVFFTIYGAWFANITTITNSDHLIYPYLLKSPTLHDLVAPGDHTNFLKYPIFLLQANFPYNIYTATVVNISLAVITIVLWVLLMVYIFGKRYFALICLTFSSVIAASALLNFELVGPAIRNIEYPIALAFVVLLSKYAAGIRLSKLWIVALVSITLVYTVAIASDSLLIYAVTAPLVVVLLIGYRFQRNKKRTLQAFGVITLSTIGAIIMRLIAENIGLAILYTNKDNQLTTIAFDKIVPSILETLKQLFDLSGANIFGQVVGPGILLSIINFCLVIIGLAGLTHVISYIVKGSPYAIKGYSPARSLTISVLSVSFLVTTVVYIFLDLVLRTGSNGALVSAGQDRYLTLLPLLIISGVIFVLKKYMTKNLHLYVYVTIMGSIIISFPALHSSRVKVADQLDNGIGNSLSRIGTVVKEEGAELIVAGYWHAASSKFYSDESIKFASIENCNQPAPKFNYRKSFYKPSSSIKKSVLIVDRTGPDSIYWNCTDEQILAIYGVAEKKITIKESSSTPITILVYDYDIRTKIKSF